MQGRGGPARRRPPRRSANPHAPFENPHGFEKQPRQPQRKGIEHLLKNIEKKRQLSIKEFSKTDLNKSDDFEEVIFWYEEIINHPDSITPLKIAIQEETQFNGGAPIVGNIAEVVYLPAEEDGSLPTAVSVTADKTFPQALGKWESRNERNLDIEIELLP
ncbi:MAG: hypothetical protein IIV41_00770, partial [Akkermansia sp.]|nr:hypothetical protein [Akkermansia sp.]